MPTVDANSSAVETFATACERMLTWFAGRVARGYRSQATLDFHRQVCRLWCERLGELELSEITPELLEVATLEESHGRRKRLDPGTLNKRLSTLALVLRHAHQRGAIAEVPTLTRAEHRYQPDERYIEDPADYFRVLYALPQNRAEWFALAVWSGQRASDVDRARREDMGPDWVRVRSTKTHKGRGIKIAAPAELVRVLGPRWRTLPPKARLVDPWPHVSKQLPALCERLGIQPLVANSLRHTFFTWYVAANGFTPELLDIGGWSSMYIPSKVYAHALRARFQPQIAQLAKTFATHQISPADGPRAEKEGPSGVGAPEGPENPAAERRRRPDRRVGPRRQTDKVCQCSQWAHKESNLEPTD